MSIALSIVTVTACFFFNFNANFGVKTTVQSCSSGAV